jgi:hypothetical protein
MFAFFEPTIRGPHPVTRGSNPDQNIDGPNCMTIKSTTSVMTITASALGRDIRMAVVQIQRFWLEKTDLRIKQG